MTRTRIALTKRLLLIGPFPPPIGGETVSTLKLTGSRYWEKAGVHLTTINLYGRGKIRLQGDRITLMNILRAFRVLIQSLFRIPGSDHVLLWITRRSLCSLGLAIILISRLFGKPVVVKVFGSYLVEQISEYSPWYRRFILSVLSRAERVLPQTEAIVRELVDDLGMDQSLIECFPNFLLDEALTERRPQREFTGKCVFVGHIKEEKGVFDIIEALGSKQGFSCDFYGELIHKDRESFLSLITKHENLKYNGVIEPSSVIPMIREHDILLLPTTHIGEGFPAVILEGFAAGVPIVASDWKSIPDIIDDGHNGLIIRPGDPAGIAEAVERLAGDPGLYERISAGGYRSADSYTEKAVVKELLIENILGLETSG